MSKGKREREVSEAYWKRDNKLREKFAEDKVDAIRLDREETCQQEADQEVLQDKVDEYADKLADQCSLLRLQRIKEGYEAVSVFFDASNTGFDVERGVQILKALRNA